MTGRLAGKVALITGTADGQGRAAALAFAREGAKVVGCDLKTELAEETVALVRHAGGEMVSMQPLNLNDEDQLKTWIDFAVSHYGDFDILYNNASGVRGGTIESLTRADWDFNLANEVTILFLAIKHALPVFKRRGGGVILNTGSVAGMVGAAMPGNIAGNFVHNVSKAAVIRMTEHLAIELSPWNIRVNTVSPGLIDTPATRPLLDVGGTEPFTRSLLIRRPGQSEDIARAAVFMCSDEADYITGVNLPVDGGWTASGGLGQPDPQMARIFGEAMNALSNIPGGRS
ncbi:MAG: SDR family NAD(P)-dependent oxidoreductase [Immundisolibacter sp.]|uniref:SDR family NAD(P)-dependent oxidoreductase n=1 Tax=Immundisolibacter sp. TaxID=1934948 RepID=UPI00356A1DDB